MVQEREYRSALRIAKDFRLGINREDLDAMRLAYECMVHPVFYRQIGRDLDIEVERGIGVLVRLYGEGVIVLRDKKPERFGMSYIPAPRPPRREPGMEMVLSFVERATGAKLSSLDAEVLVTLIKALKKEDE